MTQVVELPDQELAMISVPIGDICIAGCQVVFHMNIPRQEGDVANPLGIPTSIYNDPAMPRTLTLKSKISGEQVCNRFCVISQIFNHFSSYM